MLGTYIGAQGGQTRGWDPLELKLVAILSYLVWLLGTELGASGKQ